MLMPELTLVREAASTREDTLSIIAEAAVRRFPQLASPALVRAFLERESAYATSTPEGVAFPHVQLPEIAESSVVVLLLRQGVNWSGTKHPPQNLIFGILGHAEAPWEHVRLLARLARILRAAGSLERFRAATDESQLYERLIEEDRRYG